MGIALEPRQPGIDDVADARHGQRCLGDVGRQHHAPALVRLEYPALLLRRLAREQRQDFSGRAARPGERMLAQGFRRLADLPLARQEYQHVAGPGALRFVDGVDDGIVDLPVLVGRPILHRPPAHFDGIEAARDLDHRSIAEMA